MVDKPFNEIGAPDKTLYDYIGGIPNVNHSYTMATYNPTDGYVWLQQSYSGSQIITVSLYKYYMKKTV